MVLTASGRVSRAKVLRLRAWMEDRGWYQNRPQTLYVGEDEFFLKHREHFAGVKLWGFILVYEPEPGAWDLETGKTIR